MKKNMDLKKVHRLENMNLENKCVFENFHKFLRKVLNFKKVHEFGKTMFTNLENKSWI